MAARFKAEQVVTLMDSRLQHKLKPEQREALTAAILRSGVQDDLLFRRETISRRPPLWTLSGGLSWLRLLWARHVLRVPIDDEAWQLTLWAAAVRRSGARRLLVAMLIALVCGLINFGLPVELSIQALRDKVRPVEASGEIVVVAKDERSRQAFGQLPWSRRYDALLLDRLREMGAKRIVFNELFDRALNPADDADFAAALRRTRGNVWLSAYSEADEMSGKFVDVMPAAKFGMSCCLANSYTWNDPFGFVNNIPYTANIGGVDRPSPALVLAGGRDGMGPMRPDTAIRASSIPTISASAVLTRSISPAAIRGKSVIIGRISRNSAEKIHMLGQGKVSGAYVQVIGAETIRNGVARELGWIPPLLAAFVIGLICVMRTLHRGRMRALLLGIAMIIGFALVGDRIGIHVELFPALLALTIFGLRDHRQRRLMALDHFGIRDGMHQRLLCAQMTDPVSGLPSLAGLAFMPEKERCIAAALKVERFAHHVAALDPQGQRAFVRAVASRINIIFPDQTVHQGGDGLFVWLIAPGDTFDPLSIIAQLTALFRIKVPAGKQQHDIGIAVGFGSDIDEPFTARLAVAIDRARISLFGTLTSVG